MRYAARPGEIVTVVVTEGMQTAISLAGSVVIVDFNSFLRNATRVLGVPASNLTVTLTQQPMDISGRLSLNTNILIPSSGPDNRVNITLDTELEVFLVSIGHLLQNDSGIYNIEACAFKNTPSETCLNASVTLFLILDCE